MIVTVADLPPIEQERIVCSVAASAAYGVPADIMLAIAEIEGGTPQSLSANRNETHDVGYMQFNSAYLADLSRKYGYDYAEFAGLEGCYSFFLAAWRVKRHLENDRGNVWQKAANYHSRTREYNLTYQRKLKRVARKWAAWLKVNFSIKNY